MARVYKLKTEIIGKGRDSILMVLESIAREIRNNEKAGLIGSTGTRARGTFTLELLPGGVEPEDTEPLDKATEPLDKATEPLDKATEPAKVEPVGKVEPAAKRRPAPPPKREPAAVK